MPPPPLSAFVERFWLREEDAQPYPLERALPTGAPALWIELGGDGLRVATQRDPHRMTTFHTSTLLGASSRWSIVAAGRRFARMGVRFTPNGATAFFAPPASELHNAQIPLDALWETQPPTSSVSASSPSRRQRRASTGWNVCCWRA